MRIKKLGLITGTAMVIATSGLPVMALGPTYSHATVANDQNSSGQVADTSTNVNTSKPSSAGDSNPKLANAHLKSCQNRQHAIDNILRRIVSRGQNQLELFTTIANRVEAFKTNKNLTVANYDQMLTTLLADHTKATNDLSTMKTTDTLDCNSPDPKGLVTAFKADLQQEISDLKTYRTDVKNLIVAVKTSIGQSTTSKPTSSTSTSGGN